MLGIILWHWVSWHAAAWIYSSNFFQPLIQFDHIKSANWEHCCVVSQVLSLAAAQEKASQSWGNHGSHLTSVSPSLFFFFFSLFLFSLLKLLFQSFLIGHVFKISLHNHCSVVSFPLTHIKLTCGASARAWPILRGAVFLCLEGKVLIMEPTIASAFFAATRCCWFVISYDLLEAQDLSHRTYPFVAYPLLVQVIIPG